MKKSMEWTSIKKDGGNWILILGCPLMEKHSLAFNDQNISGPTFAKCASCEHQIGNDYEVPNADGSLDGASVLPDRLECGLTSHIYRLNDITIH